MFDTQEVQALLTQLASPFAEVDNAERIELIRALENLKNAAAGAQAELAADLDLARRAEDAERGVPRERRGRGVAAEIALARRESLHRGQQSLGLAKVLRSEMPCTHAALRAGVITEWRAKVLLRETAYLSRDDRAAVDATPAGDASRLEAMGDGEAESEARKLAYELDPHAFVARRARAESDRHVSLRPAPDVMSQLSALLPVKDGVAVFAALQAAADSGVARGDERSRGQIMADTLVARVTGIDEASTVEVTVRVVVPDTVLTGQSDEACHVEGYGAVPADLARDLGESATWLQRLYATPATGELVAMDSVRRLFPDGLKRFLRLRDRTCRMPWCDAPVRHADHVEPAELGGPTSAANGQGLCEAHNHAKQAHGWSARPRPGPTHTIETTTPTGHSYVSSAPPTRRPRYVQTRPGVWTLIA